MNAVGAHVGSNLNFTHDHRFFGQDTAARLNWHRLRHAPRHLHRANTGLARRFSALFENVLQHIHDFRGIGALELDKLTHHFRRRHVHLVNHTGKLANDVGVLRHQEAGRFRQGQNVDRA